MSIEKKSLISTLRSAKKANVVSSTPSAEAAHKTNKVSVKMPVKAAVKRPAKAAVKRPAKSTLKKMKW
jgi:hypothetical protein